MGSGNGYLCSYLSMRFNLQVFGIDSSSTNTHGAQERKRKLKKFSKAYQKLNKAIRNHTLDSEGESKQHSRNFENSDGIKHFITEEEEDNSWFSPLTSYVTAETELKTLITELQVKRLIH